MNESKTHYLIVGGVDIGQDHHYGICYAQIATKYAGQICDMDNPACVNNGQITASEAAQMLIDGQDEFYVNIHTTKSFE